ncbi:MAG TPA: hypothetical protein VNG90_01210 [Candidatus Acidoferrum sp.]|nr:hypothetical protein [Candidatus Acidoferrum sp.]
MEALKFAPLPKLKIWGVYLVYAAVVLLILWPLLAPGYILTLDIIFTPKLPLPSQIGSSYLLQLVLHVLNFMLPGDVVEKLLLVFTLLLTGIGMHRLLGYIGAKNSRGIALLGCYTAGIFYIVNPFTYSRFMAGQYNVLLGYALLPWFTHCLFVWFGAQNWRRTLALSAWITAIGVVSIHTFAMLPLVVVLGLGSALWQHRQLDYWRALAKWLGILLMICFVASSYWLVPAMLGHGTIADSVASFGQAQRQAYATADTNGAGTLPAVLGLQGFWADVRQLYILPNDAIEHWWLWQLLLWMVLAAGIVAAFRRDRARAVYFTLLAGAATVLALGFLSDWLASHLPFFAGFREPQKFVMLLTLAYAYFIYQAVMLFAGAFKRVKWLQFLPALLVSAVVALYSWPMWWGMDTQLHPVQYPADWYAVNAQLDRDTSSGSVLFLPWHLYMSFGFADRIIANPAPKFFDWPVIVSDNPEFNTAGPSVYDPLKYQLSNTVLPAAAAGKPVTARLRQLGIRYILLAKELDWQQYNYWGAQPGLRLQANTHTLLLYKIE